MLRPLHAQDSAICAFLPNVLTVTGTIDSRAKCPVPATAQLSLTVYTRRFLVLPEIGSLRAAIPERVPPRAVG